MTFKPAIPGPSDDLHKLPWSCLALRTLDGVGLVPSVALLYGSMQGKTGQVDIPGVVRYAHSCCQIQWAVCCSVFSITMPPLPQVPGPSHLSSGSACRPGCRHLPLGHQNLAKYNVAAPSMQGNQPMSEETLNIYLRQAFELAGEPVLDAAAFGHGCR